MFWWQSLFHKRRLREQLDSEVRFHIQELIEANLAAGLSPEEARRKALLDFGGREQIKEELHDVYRWALLENTLANLKSALRFIRKSPGFAITVILTLAIGIGANSAVFSGLNAVLLRPLRFPDADRLVRIDQRNQKVNVPNTLVAPLRLEDWNRMNSTFAAITGYYTNDGSETSGELPEKLKVAFVAPRFLKVWGISPALGRDFTPEEERFGGPQAIIISERYWQRRFGADPRAVGKTLRLGTYSYSIAGVLPTLLDFPEHDVDVWIPVPPDSPVANFRGATWYTAIGRLKPGVTVNQAQADLATVQARPAGNIRRPMLS